MGEIDYKLIREFRLTYDELNAMTFPQVWNLCHEGKAPQPGVRRFSSTAEAREYRESLKKGKAG